MADAEVFDASVGLGLKLMAIINADFADTGGELVDCVIDEVDRVDLGVVSRPRVHGREWHHR